MVNYSTQHGADWRAVHEIQFGGDFNVSSSINVSASSPTAHARVSGGNRQKFVQIRKYRGVPRNKIME